MTFFLLNQKKNGDYAICGNLRKKISTCISNLHHGKYRDLKQPLKYAANVTSEMQTNILIPIN